MGKIYQGNSSYPSHSDQVGSVSGNKIYRGNSSYPSYSDQIGSVDGGQATAIAAAAYLLLL